MVTVPGLPHPNSYPTQISCAARLVIELLSGVVSPPWTDNSFYAMLRYTATSWKWKPYPYPESLTLTFLETKNCMLCIHCWTNNPQWPAMTNHLPNVESRNHTVGAKWLCVHCHAATAMKVCILENPLHETVTALNHLLHGRDEPCVAVRHYDLPRHCRHRHSYLSKLILMLPLQLWHLPRTSHWKSAKLWRHT